MGEEHGTKASGGRAQQARTLDAETMEYLTSFSEVKLAFRTEQ